MFSKQTGHFKMFSVYLKQIKDIMTHGQFCRIVFLHNLVAMAILICISYLMFPGLDFCEKLQDKKFVNARCHFERHVTVPVPGLCVGKTLAQIDGRGSVLQPVRLQKGYRITRNSTINNNNKSRNSVIALFFNLLLTFYEQWFHFIKQLSYRYHC